MTACYTRTALALLGRVRGVRIRRQSARNGACTGKSGGTFRCGLATPVVFRFPGVLGAATLEAHAGLRERACHQRSSTPLRPRWALDHGEAHREGQTDDARHDRRGPVDVAFERGEQLFGLRLGCVTLLPTAAPVLLRGSLRM